MNVNPMNVNPMSMHPRLRIDVWSDYVCPFCYLQLPVLRRLRDAYGAALEVSWRAFELRPEPVPTLDQEGLRTSWQRSVYPMAQERGMTLRLPPLQPHSRKALEAAAFAHEHDRFDAMHEGIFRALFEDGRDIGEVEVLQEIGQAVGLPAHLLREALDERRYRPQVLEDEQIADNCGLSGVPMMLLRRADAPWRHAVPLHGALPYDSMVQAVESMRHAAMGDGGRPC